MEGPLTADIFKRKAAGTLVPNNPIHILGRTRPYSLPPAMSRGDFRSGSGKSYFKGQFYGKIAYMRIEEGIELKQFSNYRIGGPARFFIRAESAGDVRTAAAFARREKLSLFVLGGGTNLLIPDTGYPGVVLKPEIMTLRRRGNPSARSGQVRIEVGAGVSVADLLKFTVQEKLSGLEWAGGLPGTVGGAIRGNAGCFGGETKDSIVSVTSFDVKTMRTIIRDRRRCRFAYRMSIFKEKGGREIILSATFALRPGERTSIQKGINERIAHRRERHPMEYPNIGSIFKNVPVEAIPKSRHAELVYDVKTDPIPVIPAARIITKLGLRGVREGGAQISEKHPNFIVNIDGASSSDAAALMELVKREAWKTFRIRMEEEVERLDRNWKHR